MPSPALYLFKAARRPLYRKENLQILAAERGSVVDVWYNRGWVAPELWGAGAVAPGTPVVFVYTDRPWTLFVPVRQGEVLEAAADDLGLRLRVVLGNPVCAAGNDLAGFTAAVRAASPGSVPGARFVVPRRDDAVLEPWFDEREEAGWRRVVENVLGMSRHAEEDPYGRSVFFRPLGLRVEGELHVARRVPLEPGTRAALVLGFHNPHLPEDDVARLELRVLAPADAVRVEPPARFPPTGELEVPFEVLGGDPALTVQIGPAPAEHTAVTMRFGAMAAEDGRRGRAWMPRRAAARDMSPGSDGEVVAPRAELLHLYDVVQRKLCLAPADELDVLDAFQRVLPDEQRLAERRALLLARHGDEERAWQVLRTLDPDVLGDEARLLLFRLHAARDSGAGLEHHIVALGLTAESRFPGFLAILEALPPHTLARVLPPLAGSLPAEQLRELMDRAALRLESPDALAETARNLYLNTGDARWAYAFLDERSRALRLADRVVAETLLELAAAGGREEAEDDLAEEAARVIGNLIELDRLEEARARLTTACRALRRAERARLYHRVADRLVCKRRHEAAAEVLVELAREALVTGDLAEASEAVERAAGVWAAGAMADTGDGPPALPPWLADAVAAVEAAWAGCEALVEWRKDDEERRGEALRARYAGKRILIAGGRRRPEWVERLRELTGAEVDWAERYRDEGDDLGRFAERIRAGTYACVIYVLQKSAHEVQERLKPACDEAGIPFRPATSAGWRGVVDATIPRTAGENLG